ELGEQYVEVNLTRQHVYLISDGEVIFDTPCVTGNVPSYQSTPSGIYKFNYKKMDVTLRGQTYESYVNYWMPFYGNFGLHDATWRDEFGDEIYLTSGSHGCVNLPIDAAERIYDFVNPGMTIVLYWE
ncbi:MAG: L,D-transpeptidase, partial [Wujia sp.]